MALLRLSQVRSLLTVAAPSAGVSFSTSNLSISLTYCMMQIFAGPLSQEIHHPFCDLEVRDRFASAC
jgi:hypothetical protein